MNQKHQKKRNDNKNATGSIIATITGVAAITGVTVAATMALKDKQSRKKVKKVLAGVRDQAIDYIDTLKTDPIIEKGTHTMKNIARDTEKYNKAR